MQRVERSFNNNRFDTATSMLTGSSMNSLVLELVVLLAVIRRSRQTQSNSKIKVRDFTQIGSAEKNPERAAFGCSERPSKGRHYAVHTLRPA